MKPGPRDVFQFVTEKGGDRIAAADLLERCGEGIAAHDPEHVEAPEGVEREQAWRRLAVVGHGRRVLAAPDHVKRAVRVSAVASGVSPDVEGGVPPPGKKRETRTEPRKTSPVSDVAAFPPGETPGSTAGE